MSSTKFLQTLAFYKSLNIIVNFFLKLHTIYCLIYVCSWKKNHIYKRVDKLQRDSFLQRRAEERLLYLVDWSITFLVERNLLARPPFKRKLARELFRTSTIHAAWKHHFPLSLLFLSNQFGWIFVRVHVVEFFRVKVWGMRHSAMFSLVTLL